MDISLKRATCLLSLLAPMVGWAQSDGRIVAASEARVFNALTMANTPAPREVNFSQAFDRLALSSPQQSLWESFRGRVEAYTGVYYRQVPIVPSVNDAATHQIGRMVDQLQNRLAALEDVEAAAKNLYASLTPEQKKSANELLLLTIPTFMPSTSESIPEAHRKGSKPDSGKRSRHGGNTGSMTAPLREN
jgi:hypothetical protein